MTQSSDNTSKPKKKGIVRRAASGAWSVLGFKSLANGVGKQVENYEDAAGRSKKLFERYRDALKKKEARRETFEEAVARMNLTPKALEERRKELAITSYIFMAVFAATFYFLIEALLNARFVNGFTLATLSLTIGALVFEKRFRVWQIETKRLGAPGEFIDHLLGRS